jgi:hypothetical protein
VSVAQSEAVDRNPQPARGGLRAKTVPRPIGGILKQRLGIEPSGEISFAMEKIGCAAGNDRNLDLLRQLGEFLEPGDLPGAGAVVVGCNDQADAGGLSVGAVDQQGTGGRDRIVAGRTDRVDEALCAAVAPAQ